MESEEEERRDGRVLILTPTGRDAEMVSKYLAGSGLTPEVCGGIVELCERITEGSGTALIAEESLRPEAARCLLDALAHQPEWSDFPFIVLTSSRSDADSLKVIVE